jgi:hypothetical protein
MPRGENRKILHEIEILKANEHAQLGVATSDLSNDTKNAYLLILWGYHFKLIIV